MEKEKNVEIETMEERYKGIKTPEKYTYIIYR